VISRNIEIRGNAVAGNNKIRVAERKNGRWNFRIRAAERFLPDDRSTLIDSENPVIIQTMIYSDITIR
jgi:hypothetical protein